MIGIETLECRDDVGRRVGQESLDGPHLAHHVGRLELDHDRLGVGGIG